MSEGSPDYSSPEGKKKMSYYKNLLNNALLKSCDIKRINYNYAQGFRYYCITDTKKSKNQGS